MNKCYVQVKHSANAFGSWLSLCSFILNHEPNIRNAVLSWSVCKLLRNSPKAFIGISVSSMQVWQCRCNATLMVSREGKMWQQSPLPFFFHQKAARLLLPPAFKEIHFLYEAHNDLQFLFVHRCGLYHRLIRAFSQVFCFVEGTYD